MVQPTRVIPVITATLSNWARSLSHPPYTEPEHMVHTCTQTHTQRCTHVHTTTYQQRKPELTIAETLKGGMQEAVSVFTLDKNANGQHAPQPTVHGTKK